MAVSATQGVFETVIRVVDQGSEVVKGFAEGAREELTKATNDLDKSGKAAEGASIQWGVIGKAALAAGAAAATATAVMVKSAIDTADQYNRLASQVGINTEVLSKLGYTASLADVPFTAVARSLGLMQANLAKAAEAGKGRAAKVLAQLGLDAKALVEAGPEKAVESLADALAKLPTQAERLAAAQAVFGRGGKDMVLVLEGGSKALRESAAEAERLGAVIGTDTARRADEFNDNITKIQTAAAGFGRLVAKDVVGPLADMTTQLVNVLQQGNGLKSLAELLGGTLKALIGVVNTLGTAFSAVGKAIGGTVAAIKELLSGNFSSSLNILKQLAKDLASSFQSAKEFWEKLFAKKVSFTPDDGFQLFRMGGKRASAAATWSDVPPGAETSTGFDDETAQQAEQNAAREQMEHDHQQRLFDIRTFFSAKTHENAVRYDQLNLDSAGFFFSQLGALMTTKSKALFEIGKAGAIGETIFNTYRAAQGAYAALAGIPIVGPALGAAAAAAAIVAGLARVAAIRATKFGSTSGSPVISGGGMSGPVTAGNPSVAFPASPVNAPPAPARREVSVTLIGSAFSAQSIRDELIPLINDALEDGVSLHVRHST